MKINIKNQVIESLLIANQCHIHLCSGISQEEMMNLLQLCQELAVQVGTLVEEKETNERVSQGIVAQLEQYCELIYEASQCVHHLERFCSNIQSCEDVIKGVKQAVEQLPSEKMVALFLPYNVSMWDCLDSVCREAMKEKEWKVYVMPIPYASLDTHKKVKEEHYEFQQFPQDLPLIQYEKYDLNRENPDVIFYHNPYDDSNRVTRIKEDYYSSNLKKITDKLVYIPYYISDTTMANTLAWPGVLNAWKVILQSESQRQQYLEFYSDEKAVNLGSPKLDQLYRQAKEGTALPKEWEEKIKGKLVFFYNTHLYSVMTEPDSFLLKLEEVIQVLQENRDLVILWRPHPLLKEAMKAFQENEGLYQRYEKVMQEFKALENSIYDDTSDLYRSMAISDAYIGTLQSSVFRLYRFLQRPSYLMEHEINPLKTCLFADIKGVVVDGYIWKFSARINGLFKSNPTTGTVQYVTSFLKYSFFSDQLFRALGHIGQWLILVPTTVKEMVLYHMETGEIKYIQLEEKEFEQPILLLVHINHETIILMQHKCATFHYEVSIKDFSVIKKEHNLVKLLQEKGQNSVNFVSNIVSSCIEHNLIWRVSGSIPYLLQYNIGTSSYTMFDMPELKYGAEALCLYQDEVWIAHSGETKISRVKKDNIQASKTIIEVARLEPALKGTQIVGLFPYQDNIVFFVKGSDAIYRYDVLADQVITIKKQERNIQIAYAKALLELQDGLYLMGFQSIKSYVIDKENFSIRELALQYENLQEYKKVEATATIHAKDCLNEKQITLAEFITKMRVHKQELSYSRERESQEETIGSKVWNHIKENI